MWLRERRVSVSLLPALLVSAPVLVGIGYALLASLGMLGAGASTTNSASLVSVLTDVTTWRGTLFSIWLAASSTALATAGAATVALSFRNHTRTSRVARSLATLPLPVPHIVAAATGLLLLAQSGLLARVLHAMGLVDTPADMVPLVYDRLGLGLILTLAWKELPFLAVVAVALLGTRTGAAEEAARTLGASSWTAVRAVTWPLLWRGLLPAIVATFVFALGSYEAAVLLAPIDPSPLPVLTMERFTDPDLGRRGEAYGLALVALALAAVAVAAHEWTRARWGALGA